VSPLTGAPLTGSATVLWPDGLTHLQHVVRTVGGDLTDAPLNLDAGVASQPKRTCLCKAGMKPNLTEHPRNRQQPKRGRKRFCEEGGDKLRFPIERVVAGEDKCKRLLLRFETQQIRPLGFNLIAFTLLNLREFCRA